MFGETGRETGAGVGTGVRELEDPETAAQEIRLVGIGKAGTLPQEVGKAGVGEAATLSQGIGEAGDGEAEVDARGRVVCATVS